MDNHFHFEDGKLAGFENSRFGHLASEIYKLFSDEPETIQQILKTIIITCEGERLDVPTQCAIENKINQIQADTLIDQGKSNAAIAKETNYSTRAIAYRRNKKLNQQYIKAIHSRK